MGQFSIALWGSQPVCTAPAPARTRTAVYVKPAQAQNRSKGRVAVAVAAARATKVHIEKRQILLTKTGARRRSGRPRSTGDPPAAAPAQTRRGRPRGLATSPRLRPRRCRTPGIKFNQHHNLHAIAQRFHRGGDSSTRDTKSPFRFPRYKLLPSCAIAETEDTYSPVKSYNASAGFPPRRRQLDAGHEVPVQVPQI